MGDSEPMPPAQNHLVGWSWHPANGWQVVSIGPTAAAIRTSYPAVDLILRVGQPPPQDGPDDGY
jgi:hypothetical protein